MKKLMIFSCSLLFLFIMVGQAIAVNIINSGIWSSGPGANHHKYIVVEFEDWNGFGPIDWDTARAEVSTIPGNYHLATITTQEEQNFIPTVLMSGLQREWWIGAYQDKNDPSYDEPDGAWKWANGEPWDFTAWGSGQPDDQADGDNENWAAIWGYLSWNWNDAFHTHRGHMRGYIAESWDPAPGLIGIEVTQAIQDFKNSVTLVEDKTTYVRTFFNYEGTGSRWWEQISGRLRGFRNGVELKDSPLSPYGNPRGTAIASSLATRDRTILDFSLNFRLPHHWLNGTVELRFVPDAPLLAECKEPPSHGGTAYDCAVTVTFNQTAVPEVKFLGFNWVDDDGTAHNVSVIDAIKSSRNLLQRWPVSTVDYKVLIGTLPLGWPNDQDPPGSITTDLNLVWLMRIYEGCFSPACKRIYYGIFPEAGTVWGWGGAADDTPGTHAVGDGDFPGIVAHELSHVMGRPHPVHYLFGLTYDPDTDKDYKTGACGGVSDQYDLDFPYFYDPTTGLKINNILPINNMKATLGPISHPPANTYGNKDAIYGLEGFPAMEVKDPLVNFELMSYCTPDRWPSLSTYLLTRLSINNKFSIQSTQSQILTSGGPNLYKLVRGILYFDEDTAEFLPFGHISTTQTLAVPTPGDYSLELRDAGGNLIESIPFKFRENMDALSQGDPLIDSFIIPVIDDPAIKQFVVLHNGNVLNSISASESTPTVQVVYPNGGENLSGNIVVLSWTGSDPDGDNLTYTVLYSSDGGVTWDTLIVDYTGTSYEIDLNFLKGTSEGLLRVIVSDGVNTTEDQSDGIFTVTNNKPELLILTPRENELFVGNQQIFLEAMAYDLEDGQLTGLSIDWISDIDDSLGTDNVLNLEASTLSEGDHEITATATDSDGSTESVSVNIRVFRTVPPNQAPVADAGGPYLGAAGSPICFDGTGSSDQDDDSLNYNWNFGDSNRETGATPCNTYTNAGIYDVCLTVKDSIDLDIVCTSAVVYDPSAGFITGGGWINSEAGAYKPDPTLTGKADFGFVSKYKKGATTPTGQTEFQFKTAALNFHSSSYEWLVVTGGNDAKFKGTGTINGAGDYKFMLWAGDDEPDTFRIRIWEEDEVTAEETEIYDNGFDQAIEGGSIVIHTKKK